MSLVCLHIDDKHGKFEFWKEIKCDNILKKNTEQNRLEKYYDRIFGCLPTRFGVSLGYLRCSTVTALLRPYKSTAAFMWAVRDCTRWSNNTNKERARKTIESVVYLIMCILQESQEERVTATLRIRMVKPAGADFSSLLRLTWLEPAAKLKNDAASMFWTTFKGEKRNMLVLLYYFIQLFV